jgi:hypothetical protein
MPTNRKFVRRHLRSRLTGDQKMELWLGPSHRGSAFRSREELQEAWLTNRDRVMAAHAKWGRRPMASKSVSNSLRGGVGSLSGRMSRFSSIVRAPAVIFRALSGGESTIAGRIFRPSWSRHGTRNAGGEPSARTTRRQSTRSRLRQPDKKGPRALAGAKAIDRLEERVRAPVGPKEKPQPL